MVRLKKRAIKELLGELPLTAELYWHLRQDGRPLSKSFSLHRIEERIPEWVMQAQAARKENKSAVNGRRILIFSTLRYWIEHATLLGFAMAGLGHDITLAYQPYSNWRVRMNRFDLRRQNLYSVNIFKKALPVLKSISLLDVKPEGNLPKSLADSIRTVAERDFQYTMQVEDVDPEMELFSLRNERNAYAAGAMLEVCERHNPDIVITPNGSILETGAIYQTARYLDLPVVTYEFGEQRRRIWLAQDAEVMQQETDDMWTARKGLPIDERQKEQVRNLFTSRRGARLWENFSRRWQGVPSQGSESAKSTLGLDSRPIVLLATNVLGDSLTLGRQVFSQSMTEWIERTVKYISKRNDVQLIVRIHPGEIYTQGPSVADVINHSIPELPEHIHLIASDAEINTYDLVDIADLGLVYTTTTGMEMVMSGKPVMVAGQTHYRGKDFTYDPTSWDEYFDILEKLLTDPRERTMDDDQLERAWNYAYRFFFEYPCPFPWHLLYFWKELETWSLERVLSPEGQKDFGDTFRYLSGEQRDWVI